ncbi:hypothetical protein [Maricaulis sp.]|uniref:hypothetical protein n=1 Tax=Maricaulis sp. TaxID=1486257 RepID=UPI002B2795C5|nr:hypothetical protein [Maricaulis sp.]
MRNNNSKQREPKKTVSVEVRVSEEDKSAFLNACRAVNRPASSVLRSLMGLFVAFHTLSQWIPAMLKNLLFRPVSAAVSSVALVAALSGSLLLAPVAAAEVRLAYQIAVDDGVGRIVSHGETDFDDNAAVSDTLGEGLRYALSAVACDADDGTSCPDGGSHAVLRIWETPSADVETVTDRGIVVPPSGEARFETTLGDGRVLEVEFLSRAPS